MHRYLSSIACLALALTACVAGDPSHGEDTGGAPLVRAPDLPPAPSATLGSIGIFVPPPCTPAHDAPAYVRPPTDDVAFASLLEGAGVDPDDADSDWVDLTSGNFCGGAERELIALRSTHSQFLFLRGPTPHGVMGGGDLILDPTQPWRAVTGGDFDGDGLDEVVALRTVTGIGTPDVFVVKPDPKSCLFPSTYASGVVGATASDWIDAAVGNFDGTGKKMALLRKSSPNLVMARPFGGSVGITLSTDLEPGSAYPWEGIAAGDLDGDGLDELVAVRTVTDRIGATVLVYKWMDGRFVRVATSGFGNNGNSAWNAVTIGDFNGDGHRVIGVVKNAHSNFALLDWAKGSTLLSVIATNDLDSASGQRWRGLTAVDWLGGDQGAQELVAIRAAKKPYRGDVFVYGNGFHRVPRDTALSGVKAEWDRVPGAAASDTLNWVKNANANTMGFHLSGPGDFTALVDYLDLTKSQCATDGRQMRVTVTLPAPTSEIPDSDRGKPEPSAKLTWSPLDVYASGMSSTSDPAGGCGYYCGMAAVIGRLAQDYPQLVSLGIDDYVDYLDDLTVDQVAEMQSLLRSQAPWLNFVPGAYWSPFANGDVPDYGRIVDTFMYFFRNEKYGHLSGPSAAFPESSVWSAPEEIAYVATFLPAGRKLQVGTYWGTLWENWPAPAARPSVRYDYDLMRLLREMPWPWLGGVTAYPALPQTIACDEFNYTTTVEDPNNNGWYPNAYCALQKAYGTRPRAMTQTDLTNLSGAPLPGGDPVGYVFPAQGLQNVIYRATDDHAHELWRVGSSIGHSDLTALAGAPSVVGDPKAYVFEALGTNNVVYRGTDGNVHGLWWTTGAVGHDNLTALAGAPLAAGNVYPYVFPAIGTQNVLYRGTDGHVHGLWWTTGGVGHDDLSSLARAPNASSDPFGYVFDAVGMQNALYRGTDGRLHDLWWSTGAVSNDDLTGLSGAPAPASDCNPRAYIAPAYGMQNAVYRGTDGHAHGLYWSTGAVGHDDLTNESHAPLPTGNPSAYYVASDASQHVIYRSTEGHVRDLTFTIGAVSDDDLTLVTGAPAAAGDPAGYVALDGTQHVVYRATDGHLHEIVTR